MCFLKMSLLVLFLATSLNPVARAGTMDAFYSKVTTPSYDFNSLKKDNELKKYGTQDFSALLKPGTEFLGLIGGDFRRLKIKFDSVSKTGQNYAVTGSSEASGNHCSFTGTIEPEVIRTYKKLRDRGEQGDVVSKKDRDHVQGILFANYHFAEKCDKAAGTFNGQMLSRWRLDNKNKLKVEDSDQDVSDWYSNNQYVGTWSGKGTWSSQKANWGEFRVPDSGDLDIGAGEFGPNPKYKDKGWGDLIH